MLRSWKDLSGSKMWWLHVYDSNNQAFALNQDIYEEQIASCHIYIYYSQG